MMIALYGVVRKGKVELEPGVRLPEGAKVRVEVAEESDPVDSLEQEAVETGISDLAEGHDRYAYGAPAQEP